MTITKKQKRIILNVLKWMQKTNDEVNIQEPIDKPEILQEGDGDEFCEFDATFVFYIDDPKKTLEFMNDNFMLEKVVKDIHSHKQSILDNQKHQAKFCKSVHENYNWKWPEPCDDMAFQIELELEDALGDVDVDYSLDDMGMSYQGEFIGNTEV